ncbi:MAG TPA: biotin--[acetyl-CoA-carboxylase] ligase [Lachnospiraceae bacterium]|nr:biotin--[acetyl-CoA-carboxylase] ligase [Lachnospiraceae bacterium]
MGVRSKLLCELEANRGKPLSGERLAADLGVTRAAVWNAVRSLEDDGYDLIKSRKGYMLSEDMDILSPEGVGIDLDRQHEVVVLPKVDSTNEEVKRRALEGAPDGFTVIADAQVSGKGRRGRGFFSPAGTGIYMSMLLRPTMLPAADIVFITTMAAVAVAHAVSEVCKKDPKIKWVNDIYLNEKKICGILTEAVSDVETGGIDFVVVGIGINVKKSNARIPMELRDVVGYIYDDKEAGAARNRIAAGVINEIDRYYEALPDRIFMKEYKERSMVIGKRIRFGTPVSLSKPGEGDDWREGIAVDIDDTGGLLVELDDKSRETLHSGEITLRVE